MTVSSSPFPALPTQRLGDILVDQGLITRTELDAALAAQKISGERLGQILVSRGVVNRLVLSQALARQAFSRESLVWPEPSSNASMATSTVSPTETVSSPRSFLNWEAGISDSDFNPALTMTKSPPTSTTSPSITAPGDITVSAMLSSNSSAKLSVMLIQYVIDPARARPIGYLRRRNRPERFPTTSGCHGSENARHDFIDGHR